MSEMYKVSSSLFHTSADGYESSEQFLSRGSEEGHSSSDSSAIPFDFGNHIFSNLVSKVV